MALTAGRHSGPGIMIRAARMCQLLTLKLLRTCGCARPDQFMPRPGYYWNPMITAPAARAPAVIISGVLRISVESLPARACDSGCERSGLYCTGTGPSESESACGPDFRPLSPGPLRARAESMPCSCQSSVATESGSESLAC